MDFSSSTNHIGGPEGQAIATAQAVSSVLESLKTAIVAAASGPDAAGIKAAFAA